MLRESNETFSQTVNLRLLSFLTFAVAVSFLLLAPATAVERLRLATTTSTDNSGLLEALLPPFEDRAGLNVDVIAVGTGKALKLGERGDVDVVMVHAPQAEKEFMEKGFGVNRRTFMYNDFVILGPHDDPSGIKNAAGSAQAFASIAESGSTFISRGDDSGTHKKEKSIWSRAGIRPAGKWYLETGMGMGQVLMMSDQKEAYTLSDRGTYLAFGEKIGLKILFAGDPLLRNPYSIMAVNPKLHPGVNHSGAQALIAWVSSPDGQKIIAGFKKQGEQLFHPITDKP